MPGGECCGACAQGCFNCCVPLPSDQYKQGDKSWVDLEEVIKAVAWKELKTFTPDDLTIAERCRPLSRVFSLEVDRASIHIDTEKDDDGQPSASQTLDIPKAEDNVQVLFQSTFTNRTGKDQTYSFKTERQTTSFIEVSLQRGFTIGSSLDLELKAPVETGHDDGGPRGRLGCRLQWSFRRGEVTRKEDRVSWCVDNNIIVTQHNTGTAKLSIDERVTSSDFTLKCAIRALDKSKTSSRPGEQNRVQQPSKTDMDGGWFNRALKTVSCIKGGPSRVREDNGETMKKDEENSSQRSEDEEERRETRQEEDRGEVEETIEPEESRSLTKENAAESSAQVAEVPPPAGPPPMKTEPKVAVLVRRKSTSKIVKRVLVSLRSIYEKCPDFFSLPPEGKGTGVIYCDIKGRCHAVFAIEQIVELDECEFAENEQPANGQRGNDEQPAKEQPGRDSQSEDQADRGPNEGPAEDPRAYPERLRSPEGRVDHRPYDNYRSTYTSRRTYFNQ